MYSFGVKTLERRIVANPDNRKATGTGTVVCSMCDFRRPLGRRIVNLKVYVHTYINWKDISLNNNAQSYRNWEAQTRESLRRVSA